MSDLPATSPDDIVIVGGARTPQGRLLGQLANLSAVQLGAHAIGHALKRAGVAPDEVNQVILGHVVQAGCGQNPARQAAVAAGIPMTTPAVTVNKVCLSGLVAITDAARMIRVGEADVVVAGGQESMSNAPHLLPGLRRGMPYGAATMVDAVAHDGLTDTADGTTMGQLTESGNAERGINRQEQDEVAWSSHQRASRAVADGRFSDEIAPIEVPQRRGGPLVLALDEGVRPDSTPQILAKLSAAFDAKGTITAGNSSPLSDGAAVVVLARRGWAEERGLPWLAVVGRPGQVAGPDTSLHSQPARAVTHALKRAGWAVEELDHLEINEAFAAVSLHSSRELGYPLEKTNPNGGAIALGHPIGASGARITLHAAMELFRRGKGRAAVSLCGGGGQGEALLLYRH